MTLFLLVVLVVVVGAAAAAALGRIRGGLPEPTTTRPPRPLPDVPLGPVDIDAVRFSLGLRGYRMDEVDAVLDRLRDEVAARDTRLDRLETELRTALAGSAAFGGTSTPPQGAPVPPVADEQQGTR